MWVFFFADDKHFWKDATFGPFGLCQNGSSFRPKWVAALYRELIFAKVRSNFLLADSISAASRGKTPLLLPFPPNEAKYFGKEAGDGTWKKRQHFMC